MTDQDIDILSAAVDAVFSHYEAEGGPMGKELADGPIMVFASHTFPRHRVTVKKVEAENYLREVYAAQHGGPFSD